MAKLKSRRSPQRPQNRLMPQRRQLPQGRLRPSHRRRSLPRSRVQSRLRLRRTPHRHVSPRKRRQRRSRRILPARLLLQQSLARSREKRLRAQPRLRRRHTGRKRPSLHQSQVHRSPPLQPQHTSLRKHTQVMTSQRRSPARSRVCHRARVAGHRVLQTTHFPRAAHPVARRVPAEPAEGAPDLAVVSLVVAGAPAPVETEAVTGAQHPAGQPAQATDRSVRRRHRCRHTRVRARCRAIPPHPRKAVEAVAVAAVADTTTAVSAHHVVVAADVAAVPQVHSDVRVAHPARDASRSVRSAKNTRQ